MTNLNPIFNLENIIVLTHYSTSGDANERCIWEICNTVILRITCSSKLWTKFELQMFSESAKHTEMTSTIPLRPPPQKKREKEKKETLYNSLWSEKNVMIEWESESESDFMAGEVHQCHCLKNTGLK